ncbi:MAG TPA: hypothetical protein VFB59_01615 [Candidatus Saccharimonadales bacterium]|nr:hypothetical protein [Candidatus Saccharimonadales bacterium]
MPYKRSLVYESLRLAQEGDFGAALAVWEHEGLKTGAERFLRIAGRLAVGRSALASVAGPKPDDPRLRTAIGPLQLDGPIGLAPGWDKSGTTIRAWQELGARHHTTGGIALRPQRGNPLPRLYTFDRRIGDHGKQVSLNSYGFPSPGVKAVARNIARQRELGVTIPVITQVVPNADMYAPDKMWGIGDELAQSIATLITICEPDAISLGLSSPNTRGMRDAQDNYKFMYTVTARAQEAIAEHSKQDIPLIYKGDGDGGKDRLDMYIRLAQETGVALELINTTSDPNTKAKYGADTLGGGLAGADSDYHDLALRSVHYVHKQTHGEVPIIGVGGVNTPERALAMICAGANAIGVNTAVRSLGFGTFTSLENGLLELMPAE